MTIFENLSIRNSIDFLYHDDIKFRRTLNVTFSVVNDGSLGKVTPDAMFGI